MLVEQAYRYELKLNQAQARELGRNAGVARFAYNWGLRMREERYAANEGKARYWGRAELSREWTLYRRRAGDDGPPPWFEGHIAEVGFKALEDLERAFRNFFDNLKHRKAGKTKRRVGFPKFKKFAAHDSFRVQGARPVAGESAVVLPKIGRVRTKELVRPKGKIIWATISREADRWFIAFTVTERERADPPEPRYELVAAHLGLRSGVTLSEPLKLPRYAGKRLDLPRPLAKALKRLRRASRQHSRKQKGSANRRKSQMGLARLHWRVRSIREDWWAQLTTALAKQGRTLVVEQWDVRSMLMEAPYARAIADAGWAEFRRLLEYKCRWHGSRLIVAEKAFPASKRCSECGELFAALKLSQVRWTCPFCGHEHEREENAVRNLLWVGEQALANELVTA